MQARLSIGLVVALLAAPAAAGQPEWDGLAASAVAARLATAARALKGQVAAEPALAGAGEAQGDAARFAEAVDVIGKVSRRLARALGDHLDREETLPLATEIRTRSEEAGRYGPELMDAAWLEEHLAPVQELVGELSTYYFD